MPPTSAPSERSRVRRAPSRADYDRATIDAILDEGLVAHLGFAVDGQPYVIPTLHARSGDVVYVHGSAASRMVRTLTDPAHPTPACLTVTLLDGLVLARSAFHHSMNYRSVVVLGQARRVEGARRAARGAARRSPSAWCPAAGTRCARRAVRSSRAREVLAMELDEASAKLRRGGPVDDDEDYALDVWAGVVPLALAARRAGARRRGCATASRRRRSSTAGRRPERRAAWQLDAGRERAAHAVERDEADEPAVGLGDHERAVAAQRLGAQQGLQRRVARHAGVERRRPCRAARRRSASAGPRPPRRRRAPRAAGRAGARRRRSPGTTAGGSAGRTRPGRPARGRGAGTATGSASIRSPAVTPSMRSGERAGDDRAAGARAQEPAQDDDPDARERVAADEDRDSAPRPISR